MIRIGLISDTHSFLDDRVKTFFKDCDEIWHAGDIGDPFVLDQLESYKPVRAVYGNIDDHTIRTRAPEIQSFTIEGLKVFMIHIGGTPPKYAKTILPKLQNEMPNLFVCGHSHILKIVPDHNLNKMLYMNPGAAGHHGFHRMRTLLRFGIENGKIVELEVIELGKRGRN
ncbi:metallophosphoesterase family protein [Roseivirga sp.]|uniref:metallophosphoesterase family protein n=1 Tax=Roseivirga sp. TaxID=1964215 RepID=UPI003B8E7991